jgi:hypothetical protein
MTYLPPLLYRHEHLFRKEFEPGYEEKYFYYCCSCASGKDLITVLHALVLFMATAYIFLLYIPIILAKYGHVPLQVTLGSVFVPIVAVVIHRGICEVFRHIRYRQLFPVN